MDRKAFARLLGGLHATELELNTTKGTEYCQGDAQVTVNFRRHAERLGLTPQQVWAVYFGKHLDMVENYVKTGQVLSEALRGRIEDMRLYLALLLAISIEDENDTS